MQKTSKRKMIKIYITYRATTTVNNVYTLFFQILYANVYSSSAEIIFQPAFFF